MANKWRSGSITGHKEDIRLSETDDLRELIYLLDTISMGNEDKAAPKEEE